MRSWTKGAAKIYVIYEPSSGPWAVWVSVSQERSTLAEIKWVYVSSSTCSTLAEINIYLEALLRSKKIRLFKYLDFKEDAESLSK